MNSNRLITPDGNGFLVKPGVVRRFRGLARELFKERGGAASGVKVLGFR